MKQIVKNGDTLRKPQDPEKDGYVFQGWKVRGESEKTDGRDEPAAASTDGYFDGFGAVSGIDDDEEIILDADFSKVFYVAFHNEDGDIFDQREYQDGDTCDTSDVDLVLAHNENNQDSLAGWSTSEDEETRKNSMVEKTFAVTQDMDLYPVIGKRIQVVFHNYKDDMDDSWGRRWLPEDQYVADGGTVTDPDYEGNPESYGDPEIRGYETGGWSVTPYDFSDGAMNAQAPYDFSQPVSASNFEEGKPRVLDLYIIWKPAEKTTYRIIAHMENVQKDHSENVTRHQNHTIAYSFFGYNDEVASAKPGDVITKDTPEVQEVISNVLQFNSGYKLAEQPPVDLDTEKVTVERNGSSQFDIYFDAVPFDIEFHPFYNGNLEYYTSNDDGTEQGWRHNQEYYTVSLPGPEIHIQAYIGEDLSSVWPDPRNASVTPKGTQVQGLVPFAWESDEGWYRYTETPQSFSSLAKKGTTTISLHLVCGVDYRKRELHSMFEKNDAASWKDDPKNSFEENIRTTYAADNAKQDTYGPYDRFRKLDDSEIPAGMPRTDASRHVVYEYYVRNRHPLYVFDRGRLIAAFDDEKTGEPDVAEKYGAYTPLGGPIGSGNSLYRQLDEALQRLDQPDGQIFLYWENCDMNGNTGEPGEPFTNQYAMPDGTQYVTAHWVPKEPVVTVKPDNGEEDLEIKAHDGKVSTLPRPEKDGYTFAGWKTEAGDPFYDNSEVTEDTTIIAQWYKEGQRIRVVYDAGEGTNPPEDTRIYVPGASIIVKGAPTAPEGKYFSGWTLKSKSYRKGERVTIDSDLAELAVPEETPTPADMLASEQETELSGQNLAAGQDQAAGHDQAAGQDQAAWQDQAAGQTAGAPSSGLTVLTLTAAYSDKPQPVSLTYYLNDGTDKSVSEEYQNNEDTLLKDAQALNFKREGYTFEGWNTRPDGSGEDYDPEDRIAVDDTSENVLYAQWEKIPPEETESETEPEPETEAPSEQTPQTTTTATEESESTESETEYSTEADETETESEKAPASLAKLAKQTEAPEGRSVKTGDETNISLYLTMALTALVAAAILIRKKKEENC